MVKQKKSRYACAATPKGFRDYFAHEVTRRRDMLAQISEIYELYGFEALESPAVETLEALGKFLPDIDRPNEGVFAWQEEGEWLALRYDLTAPLSRVYAQHRAHLPLPYRRYMMGPVWRNEKPGPGRFRQFYQCDADSIGSASVAADAEMCSMLSAALAHLGIGKDIGIIRLNSRKILSAVMEKAGLYDLQNPAMGQDKRMAVLRTVDKFDRLGREGVLQLLGEGRKDESSDFTKGAGLSALQSDVILSFVEGRRATNAQTLENLRDIVADTQSGKQAVDEVEQIAGLAYQEGAPIVIDPVVVRGLGYYTGSVFEAELTFEIKDEKGQRRHFGSVAGGGRYDDLITRFTGQKVPAVGVSIGVDRLLAALEAKGYFTDQRRKGPVIVTVMDRAFLSDYQKIVDRLRAANIQSELYLGNFKNFGNQLKYADQRKAPFAIIQGSNERARNIVQIKDLALGEKISQTASLDEWKARPAQQEIAMDDIVEELKKMLARDKP